MRSQTGSIGYNPVAIQLKAGESQIGIQNEITPFTARLDRGRIRINAGPAIFKDSVLIERDVPTVTDLDARPGIQKNNVPRDNIAGTFI